ncbi:nudix hydrolase 2-like [Impatiens glandulifera]|uniref:nudix hydrolase 2-like n=1 Tax=Impatiens glandulifera TaxID=253017 RepID=UPI001FB0CFC9|nr:nudix hydrolase 2-like [Impatiens glandulifera]
MGNLMNQMNDLDLLLPYVEDDHEGVIVEITETMNAEKFFHLLTYSLSTWKIQGKKGVWIKLPIQHVNLVEVAVKEGFWFHHAEPRYLMLVQWIPKTDNTIPANASHRLGIGAIIFNHKGELLVVQEKNGRFRDKGIWKIPTGTVDEGEDIVGAAIREVKEETGIDADFVDVVAFRESHKALFGKSEILFLCILKAKSFKIQKQELEIEAAQWMGLEEFGAQTFVKNDGTMKYVFELGCLLLAKSETKTIGDENYTGFTPFPIISAFIEDEMSYIYVNRCPKVLN